MESGVLVGELLKSTEQMSDCPELLNLRRAAAQASKRYTTLLAERDRLGAVTGLTAEDILDIIFETLDAEQAARARLCIHTRDHGCER